jgi:hypothetical protein
MKQQGYDKIIDIPEFSTNLTLWVGALFYDKECDLLCSAWFNFVDQWQYTWLSSKSNLSSD